MRRQRLQSGLIVVLLILTVGIRAAVSAPPATASTLPAETEAGAAPQVRLAVIIVIDQLRSDLLARYGRWFGEDGFKRLMKSGAYFPNAYYSYSATSTAVGHATISTGRLPRQHGIVNNEWFLDGDSKKPQESDFDNEAKAVGLTGNEKAGGYSPRYLLGSTIGDQLKLADRRSRVFSVALKARAAIMLAGQKPDGAYWWDSASGKFLTSTWYAEQLPAYMVNFNNSHYAAQQIGKIWDRLLPEAAYDGCRPVDPSWISGDHGIGKTFPHRLANNEGLYASPLGNDMTLEMAKRIIASEKLGRGPATDLFCISFSSNDAVGHMFGPSSAELMDITLRTDRQIADLLAFLDKQVGADRCLIALTGDHGVKEVPQIAEQMRLGGQYLKLDEVVAGLNETLVSQVGQLGDGKSYVLGIELPWLYFDPSFADWTVDKQAQVMYAAAVFLSGVPGVSAVFTAAELEEFPPLPDDTARWLAWRSYCPGRAGQIYIALEPFWYQAGGGVTGHGTAQTADRHVPILLAGPGIAHGRFMQTVDPMDIAPTMAAELGIEAPNAYSGRPIPEAFEK